MGDVGAFRACSFVQQELGVACSLVISRPRSRVSRAHECMQFLKILVLALRQRSWLKFIENIHRFLYSKADYALLDIVHVFNLSPQSWLQHGCLLIPIRQSLFINQRLCGLKWVQSAANGDRCWSVQCWFINLLSLLVPWKYPFISH